MAEVTFTGKKARSFAGVSWTPECEPREVKHPLHLDYYNRHPEFKVKGTIPDKPSVVAEKQAAKRAPSKKA